MDGKYIHDPELARRLGISTRTFYLIKKGGAVSRKSWNRLEIAENICGVAAESPPVLKERPPYSYGTIRQPNLIDAIFRAHAALGEAIAILAGKPVQNPAKQDGEKGVGHA